MTRLTRCWLLASLVLGCTSTAYGQPAVDPRTAEFNPSPDHSALDNGVPIVARYDLEFYLIGGAQPVRVLALGKPSPDPDGVIRVDFTALLNPPLAAGVTHEARVVAVGPGGSGRSTPSNTFLFQAGTCSYSVTPTSRSVAVGGGTSTFSVATTAGCSWTAASQARTVTLQVSANGQSTPRTMTLTVAGRTLTLTQSGAALTTPRGLRVVP